MPGIQKNVSGDQPPMGVNAYLRSTQPGTFATDGATVAASTHPIEPGLAGNQKFLDKGEILAKITSGPEAGKFGVFSLDTVGVTNGLSTPANIVGINNSYYPYQLMDHDVYVGNLYYGVVKQARVTVRDATGKRVPVTNAIVDALADRKDLKITWK